MTGAINTTASFVEFTTAKNAKFLAAWAFQLGSNAA
jgi:hypothetical protein